MEDLGQEESHGDGKCQLLGKFRKKTIFVDRLDLMLGELVLSQRGLQDPFPGPL